MLLTRRHAATTFSGLLLIACSAPAREDQPALLVAPTPAVRAELAQALASEFGGATIPLADDALTTVPSLELEHARPRDADGRLIQGRELGRPEVFRLLLSGGRCVLLRERNGHRLPLNLAQCVVIAPK